MTGSYTNTRKILLNDHKLKKEFFPGGNYQHSVRNQL